MKILTSCVAKFMVRAVEFTIIWYVMRFFAHKESIFEGKIVTLYELYAHVFGVGEKSVEKMIIKIYIKTEPLLKFV